ncbi:transposable element Tc1 transposase [Trichonephila clavipes]|nr:transposable element Tc1 transposase [Trichonephila clavipes]
MAWLHLRMDRWHHDYYAKVAVLFVRPGSPMKTTSGCFYLRSNHWEVGGRPQCDKWLQSSNCSQHRFTTLETISNYRNSYPGFSSGRPRGTTPADDRYIVLQARRNRRQTAGEIARHTTQATGRPISRFLPWPEAYTVVVCLHDALYDESRFSLSSDSHRILIWRERGSRNHPSNIIERDRCMEVAVFSFGEASCLVVVQTFTSSTQVQSTGPVIVTRFFFHMWVFFRGAMCLQFLFMDDNAPCHRTVAAEQLLESEDIERMDWPARSPDLNPIEHVWDFLGRRLAARNLTTSNGSGASFGAARRMGSDASTTH